MYDLIGVLPVVGEFADTAKLGLAASKALRAVNKIDDVADTMKMIDKVDDIGDGAKAIDKVDDAVKGTKKIVIDGVNDDKIELLADINKMITPYEKRVIETVPKKKGYFDFAAHGAPNHIEYGARNNKMSARELARVIKHNDAYNGEKVRLLSCSTGSTKNGFAQQLANALGVEVEAPTDVLFIYPNGQMKVGYDGSGIMKIFRPYIKE